jgi:serine/threonine protein kinase
MLFPGFQGLLFSKFNLFRYTEVDCWAVGILAYECLVGQTPYEAHTMDQALELIEARALFVDRRPENNHNAHHGLTQDARSFILACLDVEPATRITAAEMLSHPWIVNHHPHQQAPPPPPTTTREAPRDALHVSSDGPVTVVEPRHRGSSTASAIMQHLGEVLGVSGPTTAAAAAPMPQPPPSVPTAAPRPPLVKACTYPSHALPDHPRDDGGGRGRGRPGPASTTPAVKKK